MAMTKERFIKLRKKGLSIDQIHKFERGEKPQSVQQPSTTTSTSPQMDPLSKSQGGFLRTAGDFLGTSGMARGITQGIFLRTPEGKAILKDIEEGKSTYEDLTKLTGKPSTPKQVVGSALQMGTSYAAARLPASKTLKGAIGAGSAISGSQAFGRGIESDKSIGESAKGSIWPTVLGGALGATGYGVKSLIGNATKDAPEVLMDKALKTSQKIKETGKSPAKDLIKKGWWGSLKSIYKKTTDGITANENLIEKELSKSKKVIKSNELGQRIWDEAKKLYSKNYSDKQISQALSKVPINQIYKQQSLTIKELNTLRRSLDKIIGDPKWGKDIPQLSQGIAKNVANIMRNLVKTSEPTTKKAFSEWSKLINTQKVLNKAIGKTSTKFGIGMKDIMVALGVGVPSGNVLPAVGAVALKKFLETPSAMTGTAVGLSRFGGLIEKTSPLISESSGKLGRLISSGLLGKMNQSKR